MDITFGVDSFIWTENFLEKDLWVIKKEVQRRSVLLRDNQS